MIKNFITEDYLRGILPELDLYKWSSESDFSNFISQANNEIFEELRKKNLKLNKLMPELFLIDSGTVISDAGTYTGDSAEDTLNRLRFVYDVTAFSGTNDKTLTIQGSNDDVTFYTVESITISETGIDSIRISEIYQYYRITFTQTEGSVTLSAYLIETTYDDLFAYKTLELIMRNVKKEDNDAQGIKQRDYNMFYNQIINSSIFLENTSDEFTNSGYREVKENTIIMLK